MRWAAVSAIVVAACIAGAALAQDNSPMVFVPTWEAEPRPADIISHYPRAALARNVSGIAVLCCTPREDRSMNCAVSSEWPSGEGFGEATARAAQGYRLTPESHGDLIARPGTQVRLSMMWAGPIFSDDMRAELSRRDGDTAFACLPPE